jgi:ATP-dependent DNA helicase RecG
MTTSPAVRLTTPVAELPGVTHEEANALRALGLYYVGHLVDHLPARHERELLGRPLNELTPDAVNSAVGEISATRVAGFGRKQRFEAVLMDDSGRLDLVWFSMPFLRHKLGPGMQLRVKGRVAQRGPALQMVNPVFTLLGADAEDETAPDHEPAEESATPDSDPDERLMPVYPASGRITSKRIAAVIQSVLHDALPQIEDHFTPEHVASREMPSLREAYRRLHAPDNDAEISDAKRRLAYDELFLLMLGMELRRAQLRRERRAPVVTITDELDQRIRARLGFTLTPGQDGAIRDLSHDMSDQTPMNRLVQGDVGSGKTAVAVYAMLAAIAAGHQAALMAPTEVLAEQHAAVIDAMLAESQTRVALLTGSQHSEHRATTREMIEQGEIDLVVGTHALLSDATRFKSLGVCVIDEQHRFGVGQRAVLAGHDDRGDSDEPNATDTYATDTHATDTDVVSEGDPRRLAPHVLVMTATPIPRTLAMTVMGDLDVSSIRGKPSGRRPPTTRWVRSPERDKVYAWAAERLASGERAFVVSPTIEPSRDLGTRGVIGLAKDLQSGSFSNARVGVVHGRLSSEERGAVMHDFRTGALDALVATTVIEVGVDVPEATMMIIENADQFGLAQLHQLRGRVGRGEKPSFCVLIGDPSTEDGGKRLEVMATENDGFLIAERDLEIRGWGELVGSRQSGLPPFRVADLSTPGHMDLLQMAIRDAREHAGILSALGMRGDSTGSVLLRRLMKRYATALHLARVV